MVNSDVQLKKMKLSKPEFPSTDLQLTHFLIISHFQQDQ